MSRVGGHSGSGSTSYQVDQVTYIGHQSEGCTPLHSYQLYHQGGLQLLGILQLNIYYYDIRYLIDFLK